MADTPTITLLSNVAATGSAKSVRRGRYAFAAHGTFSGATCKLQILGPDGSTYIDAGTDATLTAAGACLVDLPDCVVKATISGGSPSAMYASLSPVS